MSVAEKRLNEYFLLQKHTGCSATADISAWKVTVLQRAICLPSLHRINLEFVQIIRLVTNDAPKPLASPLQSVPFLPSFTLSKRDRKFSGFCLPCAFRVFSSPRIRLQALLVLPRRVGTFGGSNREVCRDPGVRETP